MEVVGWVSIKETLPETGMYVWGWSELLGGITVQLHVQSSFDGHDLHFQHWWTDRRGCIIQDITHWMEPPGGPTNVYKSSGTQWEYRITACEHTSNWEWWDSAGNDGWELVLEHDGYFYFKRPKSQELGK